MDDRVHWPISSLLIIYTAHFIIDDLDNDKGLAKGRRGDDQLIQIGNKLYTHTRNNQNNENKTRT